MGADQELTWQALTNDDLPGLVALAGRCLTADGGLPDAAGEAFLARRYTADGVEGVAVRDGGGRGDLVAAAAVRPTGAAGERRAVVTGMVDPERRGAGIGAALLDRCLAAAERLADPGAVSVESEMLTGAAERLFAARGLRRVFAEDVLRFDLTGTPLPAVGLPAGIALTGWTPELAGRFFAVYEASFRDRPGFPGWPAERWIEWATGDDEFRPQWSLLATDPTVGDVGFIVCAQGWITQVGVPPAARGRRVGAGLVVEAMRRMREAGVRELLLDVNVDNPAGALYRRLGFADVGRRARFEP